MMPILLVTHDASKGTSYVKKFIEENDIKKEHLFSIFPEGKEISINQIKHMRSEVAFVRTHRVIYVLHDFDKSSYEAQNALLKILEEHQENIGFILFVKNLHSILPTITSRSKVIKHSVAFSSASTDLSSAMDNFIKSKNLKVLDEKIFDVKNYDSPVMIFDELISHFRERLVDFRQSTRVLRELIETRMIVENNNVAPQQGVDHILIVIKKLF